MAMSVFMLNEEELRANVPSDVFQQHKEMDRVCGRSGKVEPVELLIVAANFSSFAWAASTRIPAMSAGGLCDA
jgi:hypothetical protein